MKDILFQGTRRRRVRVRVRPAVDDFVTAESQHFNSALNGLFRDQYKYNSVRESKHSTTSNSDKFNLQDFESLKNNEPAKSTSTEVPEAAWTMPPAVTTPMSVPDDTEETTTEEQMTTLPTTDKPEETTIMQSSYEDFVSRFTESSDTIETSDEPKKKKDNWRDKSVRVTLNLGSIADAMKENDVNKLNDGSNEAAHDETLNKVEKESSVENEESNEENDDHPKNHRAKWSEVRYPSSLDHPRASGWKREPKTSSKSSASIPGLVTKQEGDNSVKTLSDYVQAIFDTMKSAEEETTIADTERPEESTTLQIPFDNEFDESQERTTTKDVEDKTTTTRATFFDEEAQTTRNVDVNGKVETTEPTTNIDLENATTVEKVTTSQENVTSSSSESSTDLPTTTPPRTTPSTSNSTETILGKILRTSTTTKVSHMTEICYRGRCVMTRPSREVRLR